MSPAITYVIVATRNRTRVRLERTGAADAHRTATGLRALGWTVKVAVAEQEDRR